MRAYRGIEGKSWATVLGLLALASWLAGRSASMHGHCLWCRKAEIQRKGMQWMLGLAGVFSMDHEQSTALQ